MRWAIVAAVILAVTAAIAVNALLLFSYGSQHTDPVGTLSPVANLSGRPARVLPPRVTTIPRNDLGGRGRGADD
jgi:hypothetical protein